MAADDNRDTGAGLSGWWILHAAIIGLALWIAIIAVLISLVFRPASAHLVPPSSSFGGDVGRMANRIAEMRARGETVRITGTCLSSCTMQLAVGCVTKSARLGFHRVSVSAGQDEAWWTNIVAAHYPPALREWFLVGPSKRWDVTVITGAQAIALGAKECED